MSAPPQNPGPQVMQALPPAGPAIPQKITMGLPWPQDKYTKISKLGRGAFGEAWLARSRLHDNKLVVCKEVNVSQMSERERQDALNEVRIIRALNHPNVVRLYDWFSYSKYLVMVMEYADGGDLLRRIKQHRDRGTRIREETILNWMVQILLALAYLHSKRILHRDIKAENVFLTSQNIVKVGDFGISTVLRHTMAQAQTVCGTPYYFSPELCERRPYNNKSDVWAIGVVFYECVALRKPFEARNLVELTKFITRHPPPPISSSYSPGIADAINRMLVKDPAGRLTVPQTLRLSIIKQALERWETSQEALLKENQPGLPPGFGVLARRAAAEKEEADAAAAAAAAPQQQQQQGGVGDDPRVLRRVDSRGGLVDPSGRDAGSEAVARERRASERRDAPPPLVDPSRRASGGLGVAPPPVGGGLGMAPLAHAPSRPPAGPPSRQRSPVGGAPPLPAAPSALAGLGGLGGIGGIGGAGAAGAGAYGRLRRGSDVLQHLDALAARRKIESGAAAAAGGVAPQDPRAVAADAAFRAAERGYSDAELRMQRELHLRENRKAREDIHLLIKQILETGNVGADEDFADKDGLPVDVK